MFSSAGVIVIFAGFAWFFSTRRALFLKIFSIPEELKENSKSLPDEIGFKKGMRAIALIELAVALLFVLIGFFLS